MDYIFLESSWSIFLFLFKKIKPRSLCHEKIFKLHKVLPKLQKEELRSLQLTQEIMEEA